MTKSSIISSQNCCKNHCSICMLCKGRRISNFCRIPDYRIVKYFRSRISDTGYRIPDRISGGFILIKQTQEKMCKRCFAATKRSEIKIVNQSYHIQIKYVDRVMKNKSIWHYYVKVQGAMCPPPFSSS